MVRCATEDLAERIDASVGLKHYCPMSTLAEIEQAAEKLSPQQKRKLMMFLGARLQPEPYSLLPRDLSPAERAADLKRWAARHEHGLGLPDSAVGRDAIYD